MQIATDCWPYPDKFCWIVPKYTCHAEVREGQRNQRKKNAKKQLTGKNSFSFALFVHNSQSFSKCFPIYSKTPWHCSVSQAPNIYSFFFPCCCHIFILVCVLFGILFTCFVFKIRCSVSYFAYNFMLPPRMQISLKLVIICTTEMQEPLHKLV